MTLDTRGATRAAQGPGPDLLVEEVLALWPGTAPTFLKLKMACVGCDLAGFDTVADAAKSYGIAVEALLAELEGAIARAGVPGRADVAERRADVAEERA